MVGFSDLARVMLDQLEESFLLLSPSHSRSPSSDFFCQQVKVYPYSLPPLLAFLSSVGILPLTASSILRPHLSRLCQDNEMYRFH